MQMNIKNQPREQLIYDYDFISQHSFRLLMSESKERRTFHII